MLGLPNMVYSLGTTVQRYQARRFRTIWDAVEWFDANEPGLNGDSPWQPSSSIAKLKGVSCGRRCKTDAHSASVSDSISRSHLFRTEAQDGYPGPPNGITSA